MAAQNEKAFEVIVVAHDQQTGAMLVRGQLAGYGTGLVLRIDPSGWARIAEAVKDFGRPARPAGDPDAA